MGSPDTRGWEPPQEEWILQSYINMICNCGLSVSVSVCAGGRACVCAHWCHHLTHQHQRSRPPPHQPPSPPATSEADYQWTFCETVESSPSASPPLPVIVTLGAWEPAPLQSAGNQLLLALVKSPVSLWEDALKASTHCATENYTHMCLTSNQHCSIFSTTSAPLEADVQTFASLPPLPALRAFIAPVATSCPDKG